MEEINSNLNIETVNLSEIILPKDLIKKIPSGLMIQYQFIPLNLQGNILTCAFGKVPTRYITNHIESATAYKIKVVLASAKEIQSQVLIYEKVKRARRPREFKEKQRSRQGVNRLFIVGIIVGIFIIILGLINFIDSVNHQQQKKEWINISFQEFEAEYINYNPSKMTEYKFEQWSKAFKNCYIGKRVKWDGYVQDVRSNIWGNPSVEIDADPPDVTFSNVEMILNGMSGSETIRLNRGDHIFFMGTISNISCPSSSLFSPSFEVRLEDIDIKRIVKRPD